MELPAFRVLTRLIKLPDPVEELPTPLVEDSAEEYEAQLWLAEAWALTAPDLTPADLSKPS